MKENKFDYDVYNIDEYDYYLPEDLIAQFPAEKRDNSRLLVMNKDEHTLEDKHFYDILNYLKKGDVLVRNNTKVIPARLFGIKRETKAHVEILLLHPIDGDINNYEALVGNAKVVKEGTVIEIGDNAEIVATCIKVEDEGLRIFHLEYQGILYEVLDKLGKMPCLLILKSRSLETIAIKQFMPKLKVPQLLQQLVSILQMNFLPKLKKWELK